jgi:hypothetical protein
MGFERIGASRVSVLSHKIVLVRHAETEWSTDISSRNQLGRVPPSRLGVA